MLRRTFALSLVVVLVCSMFFALDGQPVNAQTSNQIYWGAWVGDSHIGNYTLLTSFEETVGKGVSIWNWIQLWTRSDDSENVAKFDIALMNQCRQHGAIPMVSWSPFATDGNSMFSNLQDIVSGKCDAYLTAWGQASAAWGHPYFVRLMWEFTGSWCASNGIYPWSNGNTPALFVQAWQHVVNTVRATGGTQISWVWCPGDVGDSVKTLESVYPGDAYVDWVGTDIYIGAGQTFDQGAQPELSNIQSVAPNKPVMLPETGYTGTQSTYWSKLLTNLLPNSYSYIKAVVIWEMPSAGLTVVSPSATLSAFQQAIASSYYSSNIYGSFNTSPITATGATPNPTTSMPSPTSTSTHSLTVTWGSVWSDAVIISVIAAIAVVMVVLKKSKKGNGARRVVTSPQKTIAKLYLS